MKTNKFFSSNFLISLYLLGLMFFIPKGLIQNNPPALGHFRPSGRFHPPMFVGLCLALIYLVSSAFFASQISAFSLEGIEVKSNFGDRFNAEVELKADNFHGIEVTVGSEQDYINMGIEWAEIIGELFVKHPLVLRGNRRFVQVISINPLFHPSFNLLLKAERSTGPVFENYLIAVDFQDSVSLKGVRSKGKPQGALSDPSKKMVGTKPGSGGAGKVFPKSGILGVTEARPAIVARNPTPLEIREINPPPVMKAFPKPAPKNGDKAKAPPLVSRPSRALPKAPPPFDEELSGAPALLADDFESKKYGPLEPGDDLEKIAHSLNYEPSISSRVAVALWMDNRDKFINGNIHGLQAGVVLEIGNLENRLETLSSLQADRLIQSHWQEWKSAKTLPASPEAEEDSPLEDAPLLEEFIEPKAEGGAPLLEESIEPKDDKAVEEILLGIVDDWKNSWEIEDLDRHMALFYKGPAVSGELKIRGFAHWRWVKKKMFARHDNIQINIQNPGLVRLNNKTRIEFDQIFESDQMKSSGRKIIEFVESGQEWKIIHEDFKIKEFFDKTKAFSPAPKADRLPLERSDKTGLSIVVHASTVPDFSAASRLVNELRQMGFDAFASPLYLSQDEKKYNVFVGRFSKMSLARELATSLKKFGDTRNAVPVISPYVLQVGEHAEKADAKNQAMKLRAQGFPGYLFIARKDKFPGPVTRVFVGTFADRRDAMRMAQELMGRGVVSVVKEP